MVKFSINLNEKIKSYFINFFHFNTLFFLYAGLTNNEIQNKEIPEIELIDPKFNNNDGSDKNPKNPT